MKVILSGCHSGPNPSPALGTARSLRVAYPELQIVAKDHSVSCSGIHHDVFDEVWVCRPWNEIDLEKHADDISALLSKEDCYFVSGLDLEARWLSRLDLAGLVVLPARSFDRIGKPQFEAAYGLPVQVPPSMTLPARGQDVHAFCRRYDWDVWVKGRSYEARHVRTWAEFRESFAELVETWGESGVFLQVGIRGQEVSVGFAAHRGRLLDAVFMEKRLLTEEGKTWAGVVDDCPSRLREALEIVVGTLGWTGGGELEFVRDTQGELWLIDWNPRFPAWIHGATIAGRNLPAQLLGAASGRDPILQSPISTQFVRVVTELPIRPAFPLPSLPPTRPDRIRGGKHPAGMPLLLRRLGRAPVSRPRSRDLLGGLFGEEIAVAIQLSGSTPRKHLLTRYAEDRFARVGSLVPGLPATGIPIRLAYSVKTNPDARMLALARRFRMHAEVISPEEFSLVMRHEFDEQDVVYNGPRPLDVSDMPASGPRVAFADSLESLARYCERPPASIVGARLRPPFVDSRFGISVEDPPSFSKLVSLVQRLPKSVGLGLSMHLPSREIGTRRWTSLAHSLVDFAVAVDSILGHRVSILDLGGGGSPDDFCAMLAGEAAKIARRISAHLPNVQELLFEPGKALAEPCGVIVCSVLEVRTSATNNRDVVVDASLADVPTAPYFPHRIVVLGPAGCEVLGEGRDRLLGSQCMELDVLAYDVRLPEWLVEGDRVVICDTGAYDTSMAYPFGRGVSYGANR